MSGAQVREAIERLSARLAAEPAKARVKNAPATARLIEGLQCEVTGPHQERLITDMPPAMGGAASGPNPGWLARAALASCTATVIAMRAARLGIELSALEVTAQSESDNRGILGLDDSVFAGIGSIGMKVRISGNAEAQALREIVAWADAHSPVGCAVKAGSACALEIEVL